MPSETPLQAATEALDECDVALVKLEKTCCMPERSPSMEKLANGFDAIRAALPNAMQSDEGADGTVEIPEHVGAQVGHLQVTCCAPSRARHYATILESLMNTQRAVAAARGQAH